MMKLNLKNSILNLSATLADFVGAENNISKIKKLQKRLKDAPQNVVFIIFDGLGIYNINKLSQNNAFYKSHIVQKLYSTIPATTTNATTTLISTKYPDEHLWLGWSLWQEKLNKVSEIYLSRDYYTHEPLDPYLGGDAEPFLYRANSDRSLYMVSPSYAQISNSIDKRDANNPQELFEALGDIIKSPDKKFVYCYCDEPDKTMHETGVTSTKTQQRFNEIQTKLEEFLRVNNDTLVITTADHGHIDITRYIDIYNDRDIMNLISRPMSMENRFVSFAIRDGKKKEFKKIFKQRYGKYFNLFSSDSLIKKQVFGVGKNTKELKILLGDYVAVGNNTFSAIMFKEGKDRLKGMHAGFTKAEMEVPLAIFESSEQHMR